MENRGAFLEAKNSRLREINQKIRQCNKNCGCSSGGFPGWFGDNFSATRTLFVSECPGYARRPFNGYSKKIWQYSPSELKYEEFQKLYFSEWKENAGIGKWFGHLLSMLNLDYADVAFTNSVHCPSDENILKRKSIPECKDFLDRQISALEPKVVVALGSIACTHFLSNDFNFFKVYNIPRIFNSFSLITSPHPSYLMRENKEPAKLIKLILQEMYK